MEFKHKQLTFAREYRGYSQTELADKIPGLSQSNLSKYEKGLSTLSEEIVKKIVDFLEFPRNFMSQRISNTVENPHYRKRAGTNKKEILSIDTTIKLYGYIVDQMAQSIEWPELKLSAINTEDGFTIETIAKHTRKLLGVPLDEPIVTINTLIERKGIIIIPVDLSEKFDGASILSDAGCPIILINRNISNDRKRFTIAHELGHLILHVLGDFPIGDYRDREREANEFASEFLMPKDTIKDSLWGLKVSSLANLKSYWLTSMASIIRRAKDLGCITADWYSYLNIEMSRMGYKKKEPVSVYIDEPTLFEKGYKMHKVDLNYSDSELADAFNLPIDIIQRFCISNNTNKLRIVI
jgi:Zn-dependent peptidase ImmA (M78 family)/transcriptional regulator with XRE-family HTH domain